MTIRGGYADLPLHGGRVPAWLATRIAEEELEANRQRPPALAPTPGVSLPHLQMPARHEVLASDVVLRRLHGALGGRTVLEGRR